MGCHSPHEMFVLFSISLVYSRSAFGNVHWSTHKLVCSLQQEENQGICFHSVNDFGRFFFEECPGCLKKKYRCLIQYNVKTILCLAFKYVLLYWENTNHVLARRAWSFISYWVRCKCFSQRAVSKLAKESAITTFCMGRVQFTFDSSEFDQIDRHEIVVACPLLTPPMLHIRRLWCARSPDLVICDFFVWGHLERFGKQLYQGRH